MDDKLVKADRAEIATTEDDVIMRLIQAAEDKVPVEALEKLVALQERILDRKASAAYNDAMAQFQNEVPPIAKNTRANITTKSGASYGYNYAELDAIVTVVRPIAHKHGLSFSWDSEITENGSMRTTCTCRHTMGHKESATFTCPVEQAGRMSEPQKNAAALTFGRRQSLVEILGLTTCDPDTDAARGVVGSDETITKSQAADLEAMIEETGADYGKFKKHFKIETLEDLPASKHAMAVHMLESKKRRA